MLTIVTEARHNGMRTTDITISCEGICDIILLILAKRVIFADLSVSYV